VVLSVVRKIQHGEQEKHDPENGDCHDSCGRGDRHGSDGEGGTGFDLAALTPARPLTLPNPPPVSSLGFEPAIPSFVATSPVQPPSVGARGAEVSGLGAHAES
jgi:hypothetical protein